jgi:ParB-like chromosome segregation protein Spo0J
VNPRIEEISLAEFDLSLSAMRIMNFGRVHQIEKSMMLHGQLQPIDALQCRLLEINLSQAKVLLLSYNRPHQSMEAWEEAMVLQDLQKTHSMDQRSLAKLTGYSRSWVSRRLSLIDKMDEEISSEIMMGVLTSSHARALIKLPRGHQGEVARVITTFGLTSRQSDVLAEAFLKAKDEDQQRYILAHPEQILVKDQRDSEEEVYDPRLSSYGNDLMQSMGYVIQAVQIMLSRLDDHRIGMLNETEKVIITPGFEKVSGYAEKLTETITHLQIHKSEQEDEK